MTILLLMCALISSSATVGQKQTTANCDLGELNKQAIYMPIVAYPRSARHIAGVVRIRIKINKKGKVVRATVLSGPQALRAAAIGSASRARFEPSIAKCDSSDYVTGTLAYTFVRQQNASP